MLKVKYPIIVEGKYDKIKLASLVDAEIITTDGFQIFKDREKLNLIRLLAKKDKVILLTDSDRAGFKIRGYLSGSIPMQNLVQIYIPEILGKEKRKITASAEGTLGVEGIPTEILQKAFRDADVLEDEPTAQAKGSITKADLYRMGLTGGEQSATLRRAVLKELGLPAKLSSNAMCSMLPRIATLQELEVITRKIKSSEVKSNGDI